MSSSKSYGIKVNTIISSVEYLMEIRTYAESILIGYDEDSEFYSKDLLRELCAFIAAVTAQVDWVLEDIVPRQPKDGVVPVTPEEVDTMKLYSEMVNDRIINLKKYNISFKEH
tara:strand:+ start:1398 stop:1736 length:339 start_codon:yes stop_codon:yes gene_type:complete